MLTIFQRLILGYLLLLGLLAAVGVHSSGLLHRANFLHAQTIGSSREIMEILIRQNDLWITTGLILGFAISVGLVVSIARPLRRMAAAAQRISGGDYAQRLDSRAKGDLGVLAAAVNRMAVQLRDLRDTEFGRKQMEHQLSDAVVQSIFEPVIVTDAAGQVLKLNQAAVDILGPAARDRMALANTPGGEKILNAVREAVSMQRSISNQGEAALLPMKVGQAQRSYRLRTTAMREADGKLLGAVSVLEDVTEMQDTDRFKTRFLTIASQKLREPLEHLRLSIYTLTRGFAGELRPLQSDLIRGAEEEAERLNDLMTDLIEVSELETGRREIRIDRIRPIDILRDAYNRHRDTARSKNIDIEIQAFSDLSHVNGDRRAVRSIMDNLLSNALRFTPEGGTILIHAQEHHDKVQFFVRDSGRGIEAERLPTIFGRFSASAEGGTGLGLALVRRLVELLGGQVSVESRLGHGTTFSFTLPVATVVSTRHPIEIG
ncbi:MAG TPA: ATP-binding protein [Acidobacteriaceae bacterium]|nr:ATP-binding protein [Acidobacteriaceae bacterium]